MTRPPIVGLMACALGPLLLAGLVALTPQRTGLPAHRILEMGLFWLGQSLCVAGAGRCLMAAAGELTSPRASAARDVMVLAGVGLLMALLACEIALSNLLFTSLQGTRILDLGTRPSRLYPKELGYAIALLLLLAAALQAPLVKLAYGSAASRVASPREPRVLRLVGVILLTGLFAVFLGTCLLAQLDRRFAAASVAVTWVAGFGFLAMVGEQLLWTLTRARRLAG